MSSTSDIISFLLTERNQRNLQKSQEQGHDILNILSNEIHGNHLYVPDLKMSAENPEKEEENKPQLILEKKFSFTNQSEMFNPFTFLLNTKIKKNEDVSSLATSRNTSEVLSLEEGISQNFTRSDTESASSLNNSVSKLLQKKRKKGKAKREDRLDVDSSLILKQINNKSKNSLPTEEYSEEEYLHHLGLIEDDTRHKFMKSNFPCMYNRSNMFHYAKLVEKRKTNKNECVMIMNHTLDKILHQVKEQSYNKGENQPKLLWKPSKSIDSVYLTEVQKEWPYDVCKFTVELALEYLMKNDYDGVNSLDKDKMRVFLSHKGEHCDVNENKQTKCKKYNLRIKRI